MKNMSFLFVCKEHLDVYGNSFGLANSARFVVKYLKSIGVKAEQVIVHDANDIDRVVTQHDPDFVIIEAMWVTPEKFKQLLTIKKHKKRTWVVRVHSKIPFIAGESYAFAWMYEYAKLQKKYGSPVLAPNTRDFAQDIEKLFGVKACYLPNLYSKDNYSSSSEGDEKTDKHSSVVDIGCFGSIRLLKNNLIQAVAAIKYGNEHNKFVRFHINGGRQEQGGQSVYKNLQGLFQVNGTKLIEHPWLSHKDFISLVQTMDLGLQVSFTETFNIVTADFVVNDIPVVTSPEIKFVSQVFWADPNSSDDIAGKIGFALGLGKKLGMHKLNRFKLSRQNEKAEDQWLRTFKIKL